MSPIEYMNISNTPFGLPDHPSDAPLHAAQTIAAQIAENICIYNKTTAKIEHTQQLNQHLMQQLLLAVNPVYLSELENEDFSCSDVTIMEGLEHLETMYGKLTCKEIKANRNSILIAWIPNNDIINFCLCLCKSAPRL